MARLPGAAWRPLDSNYAGGGNTPRVVILHIIVGTLDGADSWFRNSSSGVSAHFGTGRDGRIYQWVDTSDRAWANRAANSFSVSIENEGQVGDSLTDEQIEACAKILAWASEEHGVDIRVNNNPSGSGLSYHRMDSSWGVTACPGDAIIAQRQEVVDRARELADGDEANLPDDPPEPPPSSGGGGGGSGGMTSERSIESQQRAVNDAGYSPALDVDGVYGPLTRAGVEWLQGELGVAQDGLWGPITESAYSDSDSGGGKASPPSSGGGSGGGMTSVRSVSEQQRAVNNAGYSPSLAVDGIYGPLTRAGVEWLQGRLGVAQDGLWGPITESAYNDGGGGGSVRLTVDGIFGPKTKRALQEYLGVTVDGIVGPQTNRALQNHLNDVDDAGLAVDGDWGPLTTRALQRALNRGVF